MDSNSLGKVKGAVNKTSKTVMGDIKPVEAKTNQNKARKPISKGSRPKDSGIIYLGRIPHGFYEDEMRSYFNQFGKVTATAVARSKKTGRSRGYGFVEFQDQEVAKIAAEAMNNYLMFNKIIKCRYIPPEERKRRVFPGKISSSCYPRQKNRSTNFMKNKKAFSKLNQENYLKKVEKKVNEFKKFFEERGINFTFNIDKKENPVLQENKIEQPSNNTLEFKPEVDSENQCGVLEIDESDTEISFKTPPNVKKVIKRCVPSPEVPSRKLVPCKLMKKEKINQVKRKRSYKIGKNEDGNLNVELGLNDKKKTLDRKTKLKGKKSPKKDRVSVTKQETSKAKVKNSKVKDIFNCKESKKKHPKQKSLQMDSNKIKKTNKRTSKKIVPK